MQSTAKKVKAFSVVVLVALVAWFGAQTAVQHSYSAEVQPQSVLADSPVPCPTC